jgi:hypothetical protein
MSQPVVYLHTSESMPEVADASTKLLVGASVYLGKGVAWDDYERLYKKVYVKEGLRIIDRGSGIFVVIQTNAYMKGRFVCRYHLLLGLLATSGWELIDEHVWKRKNSDLFQVPFSHVLVFRPSGGRITRSALNKRSRTWFRGIWDYPQQRGFGGLNAYPIALCRLLIEACTDEGELVVDPFAGTGRLLGVAGSMGRFAVGYEISEELVSILRGNGCQVERGCDERLPATSSGQARLLEGGGLGRPFGLLEGW